MTKAERDLADRFTLIGAAIGAGMLAGFMFSYGAHLLNWALAWVGIHPKHPSGILNQDPAQTGLSLGIAFSAVFLAGLAWESIKISNWRAVFMPAFVWPQVSAEHPTAIARFGRVMHWTFVVFAALAIAAGVFADVTDPYGYHGYVWIALPFAVAVFLAGLGLRYILANE